jgi:hypothetical protein
MTLPREGDITVRASSQGVGESFRAKIQPYGQRFGRKRLPTPTGQNGGVRSVRCRNGESPGSSWQPCVPGRSPGTRKQGRQSRLTIDRPSGARAGFRPVHRRCPACAARPWGATAWTVRLRAPCPVLPDAERRKRAAVGPASASASARPALASARPAPALARPAWAPALSGCRAANGDPACRTAAARPAARYFGPAAAVQSPGRRCAARQDERLELPGERRVASRAPGPA